MKCIALLLIFFFSAMALVFADQVNITLPGEIIFTADIPSEIADLVNQNKEQIEKAIEENGVTSSDLDTAINEVNKFYAEQGQDYNPLTTTTRGLDNFSGDLADTILNAQFSQNAWAESWIGEFIPGFHFGFGIDASFSKLSIGALKTAAEMLKIDLLDMPDTLNFPSVALDFRLGGVVLPFDVGFSFMTFDTSRISSIKDALDPIAIDFFTIGFDVRYAILKGNGFLPKISIGGSYLYTKGGVDVKDESAKASLDFRSSMFFVQLQASKKFLFFIPFAGMKVGFVSSKVDWKVEAQWQNIFSGNENQFAQFGNLQDWGILPTNFSGGYNGYNVIPQMYCGFGLDFFYFNATLSFGYELSNNITSIALNLRFSR